MLGLIGITFFFFFYHETNRYAYERNLQNAEFEPIQIVAMVVNNTLLSANTTTVPIRKQNPYAVVADPFDFNYTTYDPEVFADNEPGKTSLLIDLLKT